MAKLYFYYSAMNAGKSTMLLQSSHNYQEKGMDTLLFIPQIDDRYHVGKIHSRIGLSSDAVTFVKSTNLLIYIEEIVLKDKLNISCILIDESQFLTKAQVQQLATVADNLHIPVLAYGIRTDFQGELFEGSKYLLAWAEELIEIKTVCHCGRKATMNLRIDENGNAITAGEQIKIGGNKSYIATCRRHFKQANNKATLKTKQAELINN